jgi:pimeloyl-ACP methyl ester carboxylesterase
MSGGAITSRRGRWGLALYLVLLAASALVQWAASRGGAGAHAASSSARSLLSVEVPLMTRAGPVPGRLMRLVYHRWPAPPGGQEAAPVILIHGSPGDGANFDALATLLAGPGRPVYALDLPGFGRSERDVPDYSILAHAHATLAFIDQLGLPRAHVVGWSNGGGVALHLAELAPQRIASLTLMASIGDQSVEGSGSFPFEHGKYAFGYGALVLAPRLIPHFGLYPHAQARAFIRNFWDTDQRPLREIMRSLRVPTMILHGRQDFLVAPRAALLHHELIPGSRLVMTGADHFFPFLHQELAANELNSFFTLVEHDLPVAGTYNLAPAATRSGLAGAIDRALAWLGWRQWPLLLIVVAATCLVWFAGGRALMAFLVAAGSIDIALACLGVVGAGLWKQRRARASRWRRWVGRPASMALGFVLLRGLAGVTAWPWFQRIGAPGLIAGMLVLMLAAWVLPRVWTWESRQRLKASVTRAIRHEFWPSKVFYAPLTPWLGALALRHRGPMVFTCANPGIEAGGGMVGESKHAIMRGLGDDPALLPTALVGPGSSPRARADAAWEAAHTDPRLGGLPVILKPDNAQRGFNVRLARSREDFDRYFESYHRDVVVQKYHAGPHEVGVLWVRLPRVQEGREGFIFAVTRKEFSFIEGDGRSTLRRLILAHPRYRCQADVFFTRFASRLDVVLGAGERIRLAEAGNHAQGTLFRDGADLITPAFEARIDAIARGFRGREGGGFDFGRFDVRYESDEGLRAGVGLGIVELNGTLSEATNLYDPSRSVLWAYSILFRQWGHLYRVGAWRRDQGARPLSIGEVMRMSRDYYRDRPGSAVSD